MNTFDIEKFVERDSGGFPFGGISDATAKKALEDFSQRVASGSILIQSVEQGAKIIEGAGDFMTRRITITYAERSRNPALPEKEDA